MKLKKYLEKIDSYEFLLILIMLIIGIFNLSHRGWPENNSSYYLNETMIIADSLRNFEWFGNEAVALHGFLWKLPLAIIFIFTGPSYLISGFYVLVLYIFAIHFFYKFSFSLLNNRYYSFLVVLLVITNYQVLTFIKHYGPDSFVFFAVSVFSYCFIKYKNIFVRSFLFLFLIEMKEYIGLIALGSYLAYLVLFEIDIQYLFKSIISVLKKSIILIIPSLLFIFMSFHSSIIPINMFNAKLLFQLNSYRSIADKFNIRPWTMNRYRNNDDIKLKENKSVANIKIKKKRKSRYIDTNLVYKQSKDYIYQNYNILENKLKFRDNLEYDISFIKLPEIQIKQEIPIEVENNKIANENIKTNKEKINNDLILKKVDFEINNIKRDLIKPYPEFQLKNNKTSRKKTKKNQNNKTPVLNDNTKADSINKIAKSIKIQKNISDSSGNNTENNIKRKISKITENVVDTIKKKVVPNKKAIYENVTDTSSLNKVEYIVKYEKEVDKINKKEIHKKVKKNTKEDKNKKTKNTKSSTSSENTKQVIKKGIKPVENKPKKERIEKSSKSKILDINREEFNSEKEKRSKILDSSQDLIVSSVNKFLLFFRKLFMMRVFDILSVNKFVLLSNILIFILILRSKLLISNELKYISFFTLVFIIAYFIGGLMPKYLLPAIPFMYLYFIFYFKKYLDNNKKLILYFIVFIPVILFGYYFDILFPELKLFINILLALFLISLIVFNYSKTKKLSKFIFISIVLLISVTNFGAFYYSSYYYHQIKKYRDYDYLYETKKIIDFIKPIENQKVYINSERYAATIGLYFGEKTFLPEYSATNVLKPSIKKRYLLNRYEQNIYYDESPFTNNVNRFKKYLEKNKIDYLILIEDKFNSSYFYNFKKDELIKNIKHSKIDSLSLKNKKILLVRI